MILTKKYCRTTFVATLLVTWSLAAHSEIPYALNVGNNDSSFSYNNIEIGVGSIDIDDIEDNATQYYAKGSISISDMAFMLGSVSKSEHKIADIDAESLNYEIGIGAHAPLAPTTDAYGFISLVQANIENISQDEDDTGYKLGIGLRHHIAQGFDLEGQVDYTDVFDEGEFAGSILGLMEVGNQFQIGGAVDAQDDSTGLRAFARLGFL